MADYELPELPYDYSALEPVLSGEIVELHHDKHHAAYVKAANDTSEKLAAARETGDLGGIVGLEKTLAFNVSGHVLHSIYWANLVPDGGGEPGGELAAAIDDSFGSFPAFRAQLTAATATVQGSGWGVLAWEPVARKLVVSQVYDHHANVAIGSAPLLAFDAWEHAYYLQYKNVRPDYVQQLWNIVKWDDVQERLAAARGA